MNKYAFTQQTRLLQQEAQAEPGLAEIVVAYTRICTDRGSTPEFCSTEEQAAARVARASWFQKSFLERNAHLPAQVCALFVAYGQELSYKNLPLIFSDEDLAFRLGISLRQLHWLAYARSGRYHALKIPKSNGSLRELHAPAAKLKTVQKWIAQHILHKRKPHQYATAYFPGSRLIDNANPHVGRKLVVRLDLKNFFPSIGFAHVRRVFTDLGYTYSVSRLLANLCCHEGRLVQGAPSSPALSNLVAHRLDARITGIKRAQAAKTKEEGRWKFYYSRYADDLIFSSDEEKLLGILPLVRQIVQEEGFQINEDKTRIMRSGRQQQVTGIVVNQHPNIPAGQARFLRSVLHDIKIHGLAAAMRRWQLSGLAAPNSPAHFRQILGGKIAFVAAVNPAKGQKLLDTLKHLDFTTCWIEGCR